MIQISIDVDYFRGALVETGTLTPRRFSIALNRAARRLADLGLDSLIMSTLTWDEQVDFEVKYKLRPSKDVEEFTLLHDNLIFKFVDEGTKPHDIPDMSRPVEFDENGRPKLRKRLKYRSAFTPKTTPGELMSGPGFSGGEFIYASLVHHPGAEPRNISEQVREKIIENMDDVIYEELDAAYERQWGRGRDE